MPDIDTLMQEWSPEFEEMLKNVGLPSADIECSLEQCVKIVCSLLDIPVYKSMVQSLHVLFTLFSEFQNLQHFKALKNHVSSSLNARGQKTSRGTADHLVL
ncbi:intraflagellar transport protein 46 homolog [Limulus polyphemus]|uniref:Intraflagellar transport protein 46 homolog n=1 Tax=Limulus polyphemus TaxID=6850 RepID=A0ABM1T2P0_LIMPO|nr:intraflagellar transport protein 46 homolog [Limulus polyphemus]